MPSFLARQTRLEMWLAPRRTAHVKSRMNFDISMEEVYSVVFLMVTISI